MCVCVFVCACVRLRISGSQHDFYLRPGARYDELDQLQCLIIEEEVRNGAWQLLCAGSKVPQKRNIATSKHQAGKNRAVH